MNQRVVMGGAFIAVAVIAGVVYWNVTSQAAERQRQAAAATRQNDLELRLEDLQNQLNRQALGVGATQAAAPMVAAGGGGATPTISTLGKQNEIAQALATANGMIAAGDAEKAKTAATILQEAIDNVDGGNADLYGGLGRANLVMKHFPEATQAFKKALELKPTRVDLWVGMGSAYWGVKDYYHAKVAFEQAIALDSKCVEAWSVMAWVDMGLKDFDRAVPGFQVLVDSGADRNDWKMGLAMARARNGSLDQVRRYFPMPEVEKFAAPATQKRNP